MKFLNITHNMPKLSNNSHQPYHTASSLDTSRKFYIGLTLALMSSFFIGSSFILKKKGLLKLCGSMTISPTKRAGQGGYGYLKEWIWWLGFLTMGFGELCNFAAYGFVPATLVTPLGALSVLISAVMSAYFLNEKLNLVGKIGCILTAIGSTVMVIHAPKEGEIKTVQELIFRIQDKEFIAFTILCLISLIILIVYIAPKYGHTNVFVYILVCSILGAFTVMSCKGLSLGIKEMFFTQPSVSFAFTYFFALMVILCIIVQMNYLNKSLDLFNTPIVTTIYYVLFTLFVTAASAILFKEFLNVSLKDFVGCICGFLTIICALFLIQIFKINSEDENQNAKANLEFSHNSNMFNFIFNNSKKMIDKSNNLIENYRLNDLNKKNDNLENTNNSECSRNTSLDLIQNLSVPKAADQFLSTSNNRSNIRGENNSFMKKISYNYKNFQQTILSPRSPSGYKQIPLDLVDEEDSIDEYDSEYDFNLSKKNKKYYLIINKDEKELVQIKSPLIK